jgi:hypothetical protein
MVALATVAVAFVAGLAAVGLVWRGSSAAPEIFEETSADGRGREPAFRAIAALNDEHAVPFMRHVAAPVEPTYRVQAIRYLAARGDQPSLAALRVVMQSPNEQPSIRAAAAQAHARIGGQ